MTADIGCVSVATTWTDTVVFMARALEMALQAYAQAAAMSVSLQGQGAVRCHTQHQLRHLAMSICCPVLKKPTRGSSQR